jgi:cytochrome c oxidase cbb3-type subunit 4
MDLVTFHSFWTVALLILFVAIVIWAFSSRRKRGFDEAARLPLEEEDMLPARPSGEKQHG